MSSSSKLTARYMQIPDIPEVMVIDQVSFTNAWPERSYHFELNESQVSYMLVLEKMEQRELSAWKRLVNSLRGEESDYELQPVVVGYGGLWKIAEEAHISTIASHPDYRGHKYGEILLASMLIRAIALKAEYVVLEVRVSNDVAQNLYKKYGFVIHGTKKNYYHQDNEDAYDMRLDLTPEAIELVQALSKTLAERVTFIDRFSKTVHPRLGR
ncbi:MAG: ribosomal protein S18-alanine N-acetyltransferase [Phototrophicaceae bacterium]